MVAKIICKEVLLLLIIGVKMVECFVIVNNRSKNGGMHGKHFYTQLDIIVHSWISLYIVGYHCTQFDIIVAEIFRKYYYFGTYGKILLLFKICVNTEHFTGYPKKHGNSVMKSISSLLLISFVIPNFKNIIMSARVYFMKTVKDWKDVSIMSQHDEQ